MSTPLNPLEVLLELHLCGSLTQTALRMGKTASGVSKLIRSLEAQAGHALVDHAAKPLKLTEAGRAFAEAARQMRSQLRDTEDQIALRTKQPGGSLRLTTSLLFGHAVLAGYVTGFRRRFPQLHLDIMLSDDYIDLQRDDFDLAIRHSQNAGPNMIARAIGKNNVGLCATPAYFARYGLPQHPDDLSRHECLNYRCETLDSRWRFRKGAQCVQATPMAGLSSNSDELLLASMRAGDALVPCFEWSVGKELRDGRLQRCLDDWRFESDAFGDGQLWAVYPGLQRGKAKVKQFVDGLVEYLGSL